jgi:hypothetical protein
MTGKVEQATHDAHRLVVESSTEDTTSFLIEVLGQRLTAYMLDADPKTVKRWAGGTKPRDEAEQQLRDLHMILRLLISEESPLTTRAWFVGLNPQLDDESPATAFRERRTRDVLVAAKSFLAGG